VLRSRLLPLLLLLQQNLPCWLLLLLLAAPAE
jgi:hypothetical protein